MVLLGVLGDWFFLNGEILLVVAINEENMDWSLLNNSNTINWEYFMQQNIIGIKYSTVELQYINSVHELSYIDTLYTYWCTCIYMYQLNLSTTFPFLLSNESNNTWTHFSISWSCFFVHSLKLVGPLIILNVFKLSLSNNNKLLKHCNKHLWMDKSKLSVKFSSISTWRKKIKYISQLNRISHRPVSVCMPPNSWICSPVSFNWVRFIRQIKICPRASTVTDLLDINYW